MNKLFIRTLPTIVLLLLCGWSFNLRAAGVEAPTEKPRDQWDILYNINLNTALQAQINRDPYGLFYHDGHLYVSEMSVSYPYSQYNTRGRLLKFKPSGESWELDGTVTIPSITLGSTNFTGFTSDGTYIYGVTRGSVIYQIDPATMTVASSINILGGSAQYMAIAYDPEKDAFWMMNYNSSSQAVLINRQGETVSGNTLATERQNGINVPITGLVYDDMTEGGPYLWASCGNYAGTNMAVLSRWNLNTKEYTHGVRDVAEIGGAASGNLMQSIHLYSDSKSSKAVLAGITTGASTFRLFGYEFAALADPEAPAAVSELSVLAGGSGALNAALSWKSPQLKVNGETLTELTELRIYRNGTVVHTMANPTIGGNSEWIDNPAPAGVSTYKVVAVNSKGEGLPSSKKIYVGVDLPVAVTNLAVTKENTTTAKITWTAPGSTGLNGGWLDESQVSYKIVRLPDNIELTTTATGTTYSDNTISVLRSYSYIVTAKNSTGEGGIATSNSVVIGPAYSIPWDEGFDVAADFQLWTVVDGNNDNRRWERSSSYGNKTTPSMRYTYSTNGDSDDWAITPPVQLEAGKRYRINWADRGNSTTKAELYKVRYGSLNTPEGQTTELVDISVLSTGYTNRGAILPSITTTGDYYISWQCYSPEASTGALMIDDISIQEMPSIDMEILKMEGATSISVGTPVTHTLVVHNNGYNDASNFTVSIIDNENKTLVTTTHEAVLKADSTVVIPLTWTPTTEGAYTIKGFVSIENDTNRDNDTLSLNVSATPFGIFEIKVGTQAQTFGTSPVYLQFENSVSQFLYYEDELTTTGRIDSLKYYSDFYSAIADREVKIYMYNTDATELNNFMTKGTLVFEGKLSVKTGQQTIPIKLDRPFYYEGKNLMVMWSAPTSSNKVNSSYFHHSTSNHPNRGGYRYTNGTSNVFEYNADSTEFVFATSSVMKVSYSDNKIHPNTTFIISSEVGNLTGVVTDGINPLAGALVTLEGTSLTAKTDSEGVYHFAAVNVGTYSVKASKVGYVEATQEVIITKGQTATSDFTLYSLSKVTVSGKVLNDNSQPLQNAMILFSGYDDYKVITNASGTFTIPDVFASRIYSLSVSSGGYSIYEMNVVVEEEDLVLDDITLQSCTSNPARDLTTEQHVSGWYNIRLSWTEPTTSGSSGTLTGYNVYINSILVNDVPLNSLSYTYTAPEQGTYLCEIAAVWSTGCESQRIAKTEVMEQYPCEIAITSYPFEYGFEDGELPMCWKNEYVFGNEPWAFVRNGNNGIGNPNSAHTGSYNVRFYASSGLPTTKLVSPMMDMTNVEAPAVAFWYTQAIIPTSSQDTLRIYYKNSATGPWNLLKTYAQDITEWTEGYVDLPDPTATYWIAFEGKIGRGRGILLDDVRVLDDICKPVVDLQYNQNLENTVTLTWNTPADVTRINGYKIMRDGVVLKELETTNSFTDTGVALGSHTYSVTTVYEKAYCNESEKTDIAVTTVEICDPVMNVTSKVTGLKSIELSWTAPAASKVKSYTIKRDGTTLSDNESSTKYTDNNSTEGYHDYCIIANYQDKSCTASEPVCISPLVKCTPVDNLKATIDLGRVAYLSWQLNEGKAYEDIATFEVYRDGEMIASTRDANYVDNTILPGKTHEYCIKTLYDNGCTSEDTCILLEVECAVVSNFDVSFTPDGGNTCTAELTWDNPAKASKSDLPASEFVFEEKLNGNTTPALEHYEGKGRLKSVANNHVYRQILADDVLFDNGPIITHKGQGFDGRDASAMSWNAGERLMSVNSYRRDGYFVADDFILDKEAHVSGIDFYIYQTTASLDTASQMTHIFLAIFDNDPSKDGKIVWGDIVTNRLIESKFTGVFRTVGEAPDSLKQNIRPIMQVTAGVDHTFPAGEYWVFMSSLGDGATYPSTWVPPVPLSVEPDGGNAIFYNGTEDQWMKLIDGGVNKQVAIPFTVRGEQVPRLVNIYRDGSLLISEVEGDSYTDAKVSKESHTWEIETVCSGGVSSKVSVTKDCGVGIDDTTAESVAIYPNPAKDHVTVKGEGIVRIDIYDISGRAVESIPFTGSTTSEQSISLENYHPGIYLFRIHNNNNEISIKRIVVGH